MGWGILPITAVLLLSDHPANAHRGPPGGAGHFQHPQMDKPTTRESLSSNILESSWRIQQVPAAGWDALPALACLSRAGDIGGIRQDCMEKRRLGGFTSAFITEAAPKFPWAELLGQRTVDFQVTIRMHDRAALLNRITVWFPSTWHWATFKAFLGT